jgi:6-phospho-beta-glucosidase
MEEDLDLMAEMGLKAYRFSIAWTRILPEGKGQVNPKGIQFYHRLIDGCRERHITPIITIYHFDLPYELEKRGGWSNRETVDAFEEYAGILFREYGDKVPLFLTINEQNNMIINGYMMGTNLNPRLDWKDLFQQNHHMMLAQAKVVSLCHQLAPMAKIGPAPNIAVVYPKDSTPANNYAAMKANVLRNWSFLDLAVKGEYHPLFMSYLKEKGWVPEMGSEDRDVLKQGKPDFISLNYYCTMTVEAAEPLCQEELVTSGKTHGLNVMDQFRLIPNEKLNSTSTIFGAGQDPTGFRITLNTVYDRYHLPILISENGLGLDDQLDEDGTIHDSARIEYYKSHIQQLVLAAEDGVELMGYCPWSALDLISTHQGFKKRYGFIYVNRSDEDLKDLKRYRKDSFFWYKRMIESRGNIYSETTGL